MDFDFKTIFISGASSDIGFSIAGRLDQEGAKLVLHSSSDSGLARLNTSFDNKKHLIFKADFSHTEEISLLVDPILKLNPIDGFVNCIGLRSRRPLKLLKPAHVEEVMRLNFFAFLELVRIANVKGRHHQGLSVVQISSIAAQSGGAAVTAYAASKAAADIALRSLSKELFHKGVRLNSVVCGQVRSREYDRILSVNSEDPVMQRQYIGLNEPDEIADIVLFLLSPASRKISGHFLPADGGYLQ